MKKPDFEAWAEAIAHVSREGLPTPDKTVSWIEDELRDIFNKGYILGKNHGWWENQEKDKEDCE